MLLDYWYSIEIYISPKSNPEMMYDNFYDYEKECGDEEFDVHYWIKYNETGYPAEVCDCGEGYYDSVEEAIKIWNLYLKGTEGWNDNTFH